MKSSVHIDLEIPGREEVHLHLEVHGHHIVSSKLEGAGDLDFLQRLAQLRLRLNGDLSKVQVPGGNSPGAMLLREAVLRAQGLWQPPYEEEELCHCRTVATVKIHQAILVGAHTAEAVTAQTSCSTGCGTCRPNVQALLKYRLAKCSDEPA